MSDKLYSGKAKDILKAENDNEVIIHFRNSLTAQNGKKKLELEGKGELNCRITELLFKYLFDNGVKSHYLKHISKTDFLARKVKIVPLEVVIRNIATGSIVKRFGLEKGSSFKEPILEYFIKNDDLGDPPICRDHIPILGFAEQDVLQKIEKISHDVNNLLKPLFEKCGITLVDFKLEFGYSVDEILLADEITPDTCRFWDMKTGESLDKDLFRDDKGDLIKGYTEVLTRIKEHITED